jgi:hypothetical protein
MSGRPANYAEWRKEQRSNMSPKAQLLYDHALQYDRIKELITKHIAEGPAREREALKRA